MSSTTSRTLAVLTSLALLAGAAGTIGAFSASAEVGGPAVVLASTTATTTNSTSIPVTVTFTDAVTGFATTSITATNATVTGLSGTTTSYSFNLVPTTSGTVTVSVPADVATSTATSKGNLASNTLTFTSDMAAPTISGVSVTTATTSATVNFTTSEAATVQVLYGTSSSYTASSTETILATTTHSVALSGLSSGTTYHYQIRATDGAGNVGTTSDATFTTTAVLVAPVISNFSVSPTGTSTAMVTWNTDAAATGQAHYGTSASYGSSTTLNSTASTTHSAALTGLSEATLYHVQVVSTNAGGTATSSDMVFTTNSTASTTPLAVTGVDSVNSTATADNTFANGFKWVLHFVVPSNETSFKMKFSDFVTTSSSSTIPVAGNVRYSSPQSSNASTTSSGIVETNNDYGAALILTGDTSSSTAGRQIDVTVEAKIPVGTPTGVYTTTFGARSE